MADELKKQALQTIGLIEERRKKYDEINAKIRELQDFPTLVNPMDDVMDSALVKLLDMILGDDEIASYYLYDCTNHTTGTKTGKVYEADGKEWPLTNIDELSQYVFRDRRLF